MFIVKQKCALRGIAAAIKKPLLDIISKPKTRLLPYALSSICIGVTLAFFPDYYYILSVVILANFLLFSPFIYSKTLAAERAYGCHFFARELGSRRGVLLIGSTFVLILFGLLGALLALTAHFLTALAISGNFYQSEPLFFSTFFSVCAVVLFSTVNTAVSVYSRYRISSCIMSLILIAAILTALNFWGDIKLLFSSYFIAPTVFPSAIILLLISYFGYKRRAKIGIA